MKLYGLIGYPLTHSFSKKYFTEKFLKENINAHFVNFEIEHIGEFPEIILRHSELKGLSVTIPHKKTIIPYLDKIDREAEKIGAVNSVKIYIENGQKLIKGYNTDVDASKLSLLKFLGINKPTNALMLGTGGASKAVALALKKIGIVYRIVSRRKKNSILTYHELTKQVLWEHKLIINATPLGMYPNVDSYPPIPYEHLTSEHYLFDLTYNPQETLFLKKGKKAGAQIKNGLEMLHLQAEKSWEIWQ